MRNPKAIIGVAVIALALSATLIGQQHEKKASETQKKPDIPTGPRLSQEAIEKAHDSLVNPQQKASETANQLTSEVAGGLRPGQAVSFERVPRNNFIDEYIFGRMERDKVPHAPLTTDAEFLRRAYLDIAGIVPSVEQSRDFLESQDPRKRDKLINQLVASDDFLHHMTYYFNDMFRVNVKMGRGKVLWHLWWRENLKANRSYKDLVREIISAAGKTNHTVPGIALLSRENVLWKFIPDHPDDYWLLDRLDAFDEYNILLYRAFLGLNTSCISCHDGMGHLEDVNLYLSAKTRRDFMAQSAFMGKTRMVMSYSFQSGLPMCTNYLVMDNTTNGYNTDDDSPWYTPSVTRIPRDGYGIVEPKFLLTDEVPREGENPREALARMVTDHRQFARTAVNRLWAQLMTFGIVEPIDEWDLARIDPAKPPHKSWTLQPSNPALLEALADEFIKSNYSIAHMIRLIAKSNAYQLSSSFDSTWKDQYTQYYARHFSRQLTAYELIDSIQMATGVEGEYNVGSNRVPRLTQIASPEDLRGRATPALEMARAFFLSNRDNPARPRIDGSARQALLLMNSPIVTSRVQARGGTRVEGLLRNFKAKDNDKMVTELYMWTLSRNPTGQELKIALASLEKDRTKGLENLAWALINNPEFLFNH